MYWSLSRNDTGSASVAVVVSYIVIRTFHMCSNKTKIIYFFLFTFVNCPSMVEFIITTLYVSYNNVCC